MSFFYLERQGSNMLLVITGPTGVGKTKMSIELAKKYNAIIINADSMQVYKGLDIGTAKVTEEEKENIEHLLFDIKDVNDMYTVYDYQKDVRSLLEQHKDRNIILVGGTGLYIKAALYNYEFNDEEPTDLSNISDDELYALCLKKDPNCNIHKNNRKRLERFVVRDEKNNKNELLYQANFIGLTTDRDKLYEIINNRVDKMLENGLIEEVKNFYDLNIRSKSIMTGIGYKELYKYFDGICTLDEAIEEIKKNSRKYAKRQYTWFNNQMDINWFEVNFNDFNKTIDEVIQYIEKSEKNGI